MRRWYFSIQSNHSGNSGNSGSESETPRHEPPIGPATVVVDKMRALCPGLVMTGAISGKVDAGDYALDIKLTESGEYVTQIAVNFPPSRAALTAILSICEALDCHAMDGEVVDFDYYLNEGLFEVRALSEKKTLALCERDLQSAIVDGVDIYIYNKYGHHTVDNELVYELAAEVVWWWKRREHLERVRAERAMAAKAPETPSEP